MTWLRANDGRRRAVVGQRRELGVALTGEAALVAEDRDGAPENAVGVVRSIAGERRVDARVVSEERDRRPRGTWVARSFSRLPSPHRNREKRGTEPELVDPEAVRGL